MQDGDLPEVVVRRKLEDKDIFIASRAGEQVGYLRLEPSWAKLPSMGIPGG